MTRLLIPIIVVIACSAAVCGAGESPVLTPVPERITDRAISADIATFTALQKRLADINALGTPIGSYHFAKAQAWLDMAMDEYVMNDRTRVVEDALRQAGQLIGQLEAKKSEMGMETLLLPTSKLIRPDLWHQAAELKKRPGFPCGEDLVARLEVQLVWAGHEDNQLGWRHAKPYLQAAERLAGEARRKIEACPTGQTVAADTSLPSAAGMTAEKADETALPVSPASTSPILGDSAAGTKGRTPGASAVGEETPDRVHFAVNSDIISARSAAVLERLAMVLRANPGVSVELQGHADDRGNEESNRILSRNRAEVVRTYLVAAGVDRSRLPVQAFGDSKPVRHGNDIVSFAHNRRVEFVFTGGDGQIKPFAQYEDLRIEENRTHDR